MTLEIGVLLHRNTSFVFLLIFFPIHFTSEHTHFTELGLGIKTENYFPPPEGGKMAGGVGGGR
jgi:hypothetical protein